MTTPQSQAEYERELREEIGKIHGRLHGRQITHKEVAKHSHWSPEELQHVLIEDEYIFIDEIMGLITRRSEALVAEAEKETLQGLLEWQDQGLDLDGRPVGIPYHVIVGISREMIEYRLAQLTTDKAREDIV